MTLRRPPTSLLVVIAIIVVVVLLIRSRDGEGSRDQLVITHLTLSNNEFGTAAEREGIISLRYCIHSVAGEVDAAGDEGAEIGGGEVVLYTYGPNADELFEQIERCLVSYPLRPGSFAVKVYGHVADPNARRERVPLSGETGI